MLASRCLTTHGDHFLKFQHGIGIGVSRGGNQQSEITVLGDSQVIAVLGNQFIAQGVSPSLDRLAAKVGAGLGEGDYPQQCGLRELRIKGAWDILFWLHWNLVSQPHIARGAAVVEGDVIPLSFYHFLNCVSHAGVRERCT